MTDPLKASTTEPTALRSFIRGAWLLLGMQLAVALLVFMAMVVAALRLTSILTETEDQREQLARVQTERQGLESELETLRREMARAREATPFVRNAINAFHNGRPREAIPLYQEALRLDPTNWYIRDLLSYTQYTAGRIAARNGNADEAAGLFSAAIESVRNVLGDQPDYLGGYVELAVYACAANQPGVAMSAYEAAIARTPDARNTFIRRAGEIPSQCVELHRRLAAQ